MMELDKTHVNSRYVQLTEKGDAHELRERTLAQG